MSAPTLVYCNAPKKAVEALLALGTLKLMLADAAYTPNQDTHDFVNDVTNEAAGTGYTAGGLTLTGPTVTLDTATNKVTLTAGNVSGISVACRWGILYVATASSATSPLVAYVDFSQGVGGNVTLTGVNWDALGIVPFLVA